MSFVLSIGLGAAVKLKLKQKKTQKPEIDIRLMGTNLHR